MFHFTYSPLPVTMLNGPKRNLTFHAFTHLAKNKVGKSHVRRELSKHLVNLRMERSRAAPTPPWASVDSRPRGPRVPSERVPPWEGRPVKPTQGGGLFPGSQRLFGRSQMSKSTAMAQALTPCPPQSGREGGGGGQRRLTAHSKPR